MSERRVVAGLTVAEWGPPDAPIVLALHGMTSTSQVWSALAAALPDHRLIAPDLPGRGGSVGVAAGPGLPGHAQAVLRVADELQLHEVVVIGHSMGAFLSPLLVEKLGDRARRVVLLDGGVAPDPSILLRRPLVRALFWANTRMLDRRWRDAESFADTAEGRAIANRPDLRPAMLEWAGYMLAGPHGALRPRIDNARLIDDAADALAGPPTLPALANSQAPVHVIAAARGANDNSKPFLSNGALSRAQATVPRLTTARADANHLTLLFDPSVPAAVTAHPSPR